MAFQVFRVDGTEVKPGDTLIDFRGDEAKFLGCTHPRKIQTDQMGCERYPSVYNVEIRGPQGYVWNRVTEESKSAITKIMGGIK